MKKIFQILFVVILFSLIAKIFFLDSFIVKGDSMEPAFKDGNYLLIDKLSYRFYDPEREDVIVVKSKDTGKDFLKRIVGLPGERIEIKEGVVVIKDERISPGKILKELYLPEGILTPIDTVITLDPEEYFLMGDNRLLSIDSRLLGPFNLTAIKGKVFFQTGFNPFSFLGAINIFRR